MLYMHICIYMYLEFTEDRRDVSIEQNIEDTGGNGNKCVCVCSEEGERSKRQKETGVCLPTALHCFDSTKEL